MQLFQHHLLKTTISPLKCLCTYVKGNGPDLWKSISGLYSIDLSILLSFRWYYWLDYYSYRISLKIGMYDIPNFILPFHNHFGYPRSSAFPGEPSSIVTEFYKHLLTLQHQKRKSWYALISTLIWEWHSSIKRKLKSSHLHSIFQQITHWAPMCKTVPDAGNENMPISICIVYQFYFIYFQNA